METILLCMDCLEGIVEQSFIGTDGCGVCEVCGAIESNVEEIPLDKFDEIVNTDLNLEEKIALLDKTAKEMLTEINKL